MAKVTAADIKNLGFTKEMFRKDTEEDFEAFITGIIEEKSGILEGRIGSEGYDSETSPIPSRVARAEKCLVAIDMLRIRLNVRLGDVSDEGVNAVHLFNQIKGYEAEAAGLIERLSPSDFATGVLETSHFTETTELGGLETC